MSDAPPDAPIPHRPRSVTPQNPAPTRNVSTGRWFDRRSSGGWRSRDVLRAAAIVLALFYALRLLWSANQLVLVIFLGILFGLAVSSGVDWLHAHGMRRVPRGVLAALIVFGFIGSLVGFFAWSGPTLATQLGELRTRLPEALDEIETWLGERQGGMLGSLVLGAGARPATEAGAPDTLIVTPIGESGAPGAPGTAATPQQPVAQAPAPVITAVTPPVESAARAESLAVAAAILGDTLGVLDADSIAAIRERARQTIAADTVAGAGAEAVAPPSVAAAVQASPAAGAAGAGAVAVLVPGQRQEVAESQPPEGLRERAMAQLRGATRYLFPFLTSTFAVIAGLVLIIFLSIYVAADPLTYRNGIMHLFPLEARARADEVLTAIATVLRKWLVTQLIAMIVIGTVTTVVLMVLGIQAALPLGIIAGLLEFVPNVGPLLAAIPAVAMGFVDSPQTALYVGIAYWGIQFLENQLLIPLLMQEGVDLPPALTLLAQALLAIVFGFLGLFVAVPLVAVGMVVVRMLYVQDVVGESMAVIEEAGPELSSPTGGI